MARNVCANDHIINLIFALAMAGRCGLLYILGVWSYVKMWVDLPLPGQKLNSLNARAWLQAFIVCFLWCAYIVGFLWIGCLIAELRHERSLCPSHEKSLSVFEKVFLQFFKSLCPFLLSGVSTMPRCSYGTLIDDDYKTIGAGDYFFAFICLAVRLGFCIFASY